MVAKTELAHTVNLHARGHEARTGQPMTPKRIVIEVAPELPKPLKNPDDEPTETPASPPSAHIRITRDGDVVQEIPLDEVARTSARASVFIVIERGAGQDGFDRAAQVATEIVRNPDRWAVNRRPDFAVEIPPRSAAAHIDGDLASHQLSRLRNAVSDELNRWQDEVGTEADRAETPVEAEPAPVGNI